MCGIVGIINFEAEKGRGISRPSINQAFDDMLWADMLRGQDATGVMQWDKDHNIIILKEAGDPTVLTTSKGWNKIGSWVDSSFATIGHNRSATKGSKDSEENAHPFQEKHISLVHNGTLRYIDKKYGHINPAHDVDSLALTKLIADVGFIKAVNEFDGAYALVWFDSKEMTVNWVHNAERPLSMVYFDKGIALGSEIYLPAWALSRHNVKVDKLNYLPMHTVHTVHLDDIEKIKTEQYTPQPKHYPTYPKSYYDDVDCEGYGWEWGQKWGKRKRQTQEETTVITQGGKKGKGKGRLQGISEVPGGVYKVGDKVCIQLDSVKWQGKSSFATVGGIIQEAAASDLTHRIVGNSSIADSVLSKLDNVYEAKITAIGKTSSNFYLFNVSNITLSTDSETSPVIVTPITPSPLPDTTRRSLPAPITTHPSSWADFTKPSGVSASNGAKELDLCQVCQHLTETGDLEQISRTKHSSIGEGGMKITIHACPSCAAAISLNPAVFEEVIDRRGLKWKMYRTDEQLEAA